MLCQNVDTYRGPFVPTDGLRGHVSVDGMQPTDVIHVIGVDKSARAHQLGELRDGVASVIFDPGQFEWVRAIRLVSSGKPISVWVR